MPLAEYGGFGGGLICISRYTCAWHAFVSMNLLYIYFLIKLSYGNAIGQCALSFVVSITFHILGSLCCFITCMR